MQRFILLSTLVYTLVLAGLVTLRGEYVALAIPFLVFLLYGIWNAPATPQLGIERRLSTDRVAPDSEVIVYLTVKNLGGQIDELILEDQISAVLSVRSGSPRHLITLPRGGTQILSYAIAGPRGAYTFDSVRLQAMDSLGLVRHDQIIPAAGQLFVFPDVQRLRGVSIRPRRTRVYAGSIPARAGGAGTEFFGVREYQMGDSPRAINWHVSARHLETLYSNEFQQDRVADVAIVLDARAHANLFHGVHSIFERSVVAAASLADAFITQGNRVGLLVYGGYLSWTLPGYGKIQRERIMQSLARAVVGQSTVFAGLEHLSARMFPSESQIVLVSSLVREDLPIMIQLRARGYQVLVISPDAVKFELGLLPASHEVELAARVVRLERDLLIRRLERAGIQVLAWDLSKPFDQAVNPLLARHHLPASIFRRMS